MARTAITKTDIVEGGINTASGAVAVDPTNGHIINPVAGLQAPTIGELLLRVTNTFAGTKTVTIKAGVNPPSSLAPKGDLVVTVPASTGDMLIPISPGRHTQKDGSIWIDIAAGMTGNIALVRLVPWI